MNSTDLMSLSAQAVITKHRPRSLKDRIHFSRSGGWKSKIKVLANSVPGKGCPPGL